MAKPLQADTPDWIKIWALARYDLRLSEKEFWDLSWEKLVALVTRYNLEVERRDFHAGLICAVLANIHRDPKAKAFTPRDFMPGGDEPKKQTPEEMLAVFKSMGAKVRKKKHG